MVRHAAASGNGRRHVELLEQRTRHALQSHGKQTSSRVEGAYHLLLLEPLIEVVVTLLLLLLLLHVHLLADLHLLEGIAKLIARAEVVAARNLRRRT